MLAFHLPTLLFTLTIHLLATTATPLFPATYNYTLAPTFLRGETRCRISQPTARKPITTNACRATFDNWSSSPVVDAPTLYHRTGARRITLSGPPCVIGLDRLGVGLTGDIIISMRHVMVDVIRILLFCERWGEGGWMHVDGTTDWVVVVEGG